MFEIWFAALIEKNKIYRAKETQVLTQTTLNGPPEIRERENVMSIKGSFKHNAMTLGGIVGVCQSKTIADNFQRG